jgi:hypothetical protein
MDRLHELYPWLRITTSVEDYVAPAYYDRLLKTYAFGGKTDLELFADFLSRLPSRPLRGLELGPGTGRATDWALTHARFSSLDLVDLSSRMLATSKRRFSGSRKMRFCQSDSLVYLAGTPSRYEVIYTLWSFSHSIHQLLIRATLEEARIYAEGTLRRMVQQVMVPGASFYLIHFDAQSDEQQILTDQWRRKYPFYKAGEQSPSKSFIDSTFEALEREGVIDLLRSHYLGDEIEYGSESEALETFLNFHLESHFNDEPYISEIIDEMRHYFQRFTNPDGHIRIRPGCFEYQVFKK